MRSKSLKDATVMANRRPSKPCLLCFAQSPLQIAMLLKTLLPTLGQADKRVFIIDSLLNVKKFNRGFRRIDFMASDDKNHPAVSLYRGEWGAALAVLFAI